MEGRFTLESETRGAEPRLWQALRGGQLGVRFRRQVVLHTFIVDFFAPSAGLVVEVDGGADRGLELDDAERDRQVPAFGYRVVRVSAETVERDLAPPSTWSSTRFEDERRSALSLWRRPCTAADRR